MLIEELDGRRRVIELRASGMPKRGAEWSGDQAIKTTWFGVNPTATQQITGASELPSSWDGMWRRTLLGRNPALYGEDGAEPTIKIVNPETLRDIFDDIRRSGTRLRVTWSNLVREGRLQHTGFKHDRVTDIAWSMKFEWYQAGSGATKRVIATRAQGSAADTDAMQVASEALDQQTAVSLQVTERDGPQTPSAPSLSLADISNLVDAPLRAAKQVSRKLQNLANKLGQAGNLIDKARNLPWAIENTALATAEDILATANQFVDQMSREPAEKLTNRQRVSSLLNTYNFYTGAVQQNQLMARLAVDAKARMAKAKGNAAKPGQPVEAPDEQGSGTDRQFTPHLVRDGETLEGLSYRYFGTPDKALEIATNNGLAFPVTGSLRDNAKILYIPNL